MEPKPVVLGNITHMCLLLRPDQFEVKYFSKKVDDVSISFVYHVLKARGSLAYFEFWRLVNMVLVICLYYKSTFTFLINKTSSVQWCCEIVWLSF